MPKKKCNPPNFSPAGQPESAATPASKDVCSEDCEKAYYGDTKTKREAGIANSSWLQQQE